MKTVLVISDSVEGTPFDLKRTTNTIKDYKMDPLLVVPAIYERSGNNFVNPSDDILEYVFGADCDLSAISVGYLTDINVVNNVAGKLHQMGKGKMPIIYQPSLITEDGEILVSEDLYYAICDNLIPNVDLIVVNRYEAELLSEIECHSEGDLTNAAREISKLFKCAVLIRFTNEGEGKNLLFNGVSSLWINTPPHLIDGANVRYNLMSAIACSMAEKPLIGSAIRTGIYFCSVDKTKPGYEALMVEEVYEETPVAEPVAPVVEEVIEEVVEVVPEEHQIVVPEVVVPEVVSAPVVEEIVEDPIVEETITEEPVTVPEVVVTPKPHVDTHPSFMDSKLQAPKLDFSKYSALSGKSFGTLNSTPEKKEEPKVEVKTEVETTVTTEPTDTPTTPRVSAASAIAAARVGGGLFPSSSVQAKPRSRAPLTSTPVPSFGNNSILGSKTSIPAPTEAELESSSNTTTSSLVSPVKTLRDIARQLDVNLRDGEESVAVTSTIEKPAPGPKAPVSTLSSDTSVLQLQALRERLNNMTGSDRS